MISRRTTVLCALPRAIAVITVYQRDSSSKRPRSSAAFAARALSRSWGAAASWATEARIAYAASRGDRCSFFPHRRAGSRKQPCFAGLWSDRCAR